MRKNETVLTPVYRFVLGSLYKNGLRNIGDVIDGISEFSGHLSAVLPEIPVEKQKSTQPKNILDQTVCLLRHYEEDREEAIKYWQQGLYHQECKECFSCRSCMSYYWKELGKILFNKPNDEADKSYFPLYPLPDSIARHFEPSVTTSDLYRTSANRHSTCEDRLFMLKGMSSSTPTLLNSAFDTDEFAGGGFFFCWKGYGVAVDPGYHFIRNLHHYGLSVLDIDAVVITHEHIDHNSDMRLLEDLLTATYDRSGKPHKIRWYLDKISYALACTLQGSESGFLEKGNDLYCIDPEHNTYNGKGEEAIPIGTGICLENVRLEVFLTHHILDEQTSEYRKHTFGCRFICKDQDQDKVIVYTSDTRYFPELVDSVKSADILIANISGIYEDDYMLIKEKDKHLGYFGCYHLVQDAFEREQSCPRYLFLSEFWNGMTDIRYDVSRELQHNFKKNGMEEIKVIPAEIGMIYDLQKGKIQCSQCGKFTDKFIIQRPAGLKEKINIVCDRCYY